MKSTKITAFQGLRASAFFAIFITHTPLGNFSALGAWGVSVFLILSGFLMMLSNLNKEDEPKFGVRFALNKICSLYPLHIFVMLFFAIMHLDTHFKKTVLDIVIHSLLLQTWIPNVEYYGTLNGPSWYLCVSFFLYLCFPLIFRFIRKYFNKQRAYISLFLILIVLILVDGAAYFFTPSVTSAWFNTQWFVYYFPLTRLIDFTIGSVLGYLYFLKKDNDSYTYTSPKILRILAEIFICIIIVLSWIVYTCNFGILGLPAFKYNLLFIPTNACLIWLIATRKGVLHRILSANLFVKLGDLSPYAFLIHVGAIRCSELLLSICGYNNTVVISMMAFVLTIMASIAWRFLYDKIKCV